MSTSLKTDEAPGPMSDEDILAAAEADPDARPLTSADFRRMRQTPRVKIVRRALQLSQQEFAARYHIPLQLVDDWESGSATPDDVARAYLRAIAGNPAGVADALLARRDS